MIRSSETGAGGKVGRAQKGILIPIWGSSGDQEKQSESKDATDWARNGEEEGKEPGKEQESEEGARPGGSR